MLLYIPTVFLLCLASLVNSLQMAVVAYLPEWRHEGADWDRICRHVSHLLLFSGEITERGDITSLDRMPRQELMREARRAADKHGTRLMLCLGGNGRSDGFSGMSRSEKNREKFVINLMEVLKKYDLDGVDYNWEYPGYVMGRGYSEQEEINKDYQGLAALLRETRDAFGMSGKFVTLAYYPDGKQESLLQGIEADRFAHLMHAMSYDGRGRQHSSRDLAEDTVLQAVAVNMPLDQVTMGLPFYGRNSMDGDWKTYEDIVQQHDPLDEDTDVVDDARGGTMGFNGRETIKWKVRHAIRAEMGGVMIWEVGQDCRVVPVVHGDTVHVKTCPRGEESSLLAAITETMEHFGVERMFKKHVKEVKNEL